MSLLFWKKKNTGEVIHHSCYDKLPPKHQSFWERSSDTPTHEVNDDDSGLFGLMALGAIAGDGFSGASMAYDTPSGVDQPVTEFGGGSGDGAGASGSWDSGNSTPDTSTFETSSSDSSSSFDSGSSSIDSGSSSSGSDY